MGVDDETRGFFAEQLAGDTFELLFYDDLSQLSPELEVLSVFTNHQVDEKLLAKLPKLRLIACRSTGYDNIDAAAVQARDITVTNTPAYGS